MKTFKLTVTIDARELNRLRMLADWQVRQEGYDPDEVTRLCMEQDSSSGRPLIEVLDTDEIPGKFMLPDEDDGSCWPRKA